MRRVGTVASVRVPPGRGTLAGVLARGGVRVRGDLASRARCVFGLALIGMISFMTGVEGFLGLEGAMLLLGCGTQNRKGGIGMLTPWRDYRPGLNVTI